MTKEEIRKLIESDSIRLNNKKIIAQKNDYQEKIKEIKKIEKFISNLGFLFLGRDFIMCRKKVFSLQQVIISLELTAGNIVSCCEFGCIADANSLLRKYRDDIFFYLYLVVYNTNKIQDISNKCINEMEDNIEYWIKNDLSNLQIGMVLKAISQSSEIKEVVRKYNLQSYFDKLGTRLNNFVHSNGIKYYNQGIMAYQNDEFLKQIDSLLIDMNFITVTFLFLLTLCSPLFIMSIDFTECYENNLTPPKDSQYWVAPFITKYFEENLHLIDKNCIDYLRNNTPMQFD